MRNKSLNQECFSSFAQPKNTAVSTFSSFHRPQWQFLYFNKWNPYPLIYLKPGKRYPSRAEPPQIGHFREYLPPRIVSSPFLKLFVACFCRKVLSERWGESFSLSQAECWIHCNPFFTALWLAVNLDSYSLRANQYRLENRTTEKFCSVNAWNLWLNVNR